MSHFNIDGRPIGAGQPTFVIAELGVNHDGSANKAIELVKIAANCGASAVKLQIFRAATLLHASAPLAEYQKAQVAGDSAADMLRKYELSTDELRRIVKLIRDLKMVPLATPFSPQDVETCEMLRLPAIKIASPDLVNYLLLQRAAQAGKPLLLSTGAADLDEIDLTVRWMEEWNSSFALLHCISAYPTPAAQANLCWIAELGQRYRAPIGFSDHTTETFTGAMAVSAGADIVERHLTYDRSARGPDHAASSDPAQFERYVKMIRDADTLRGLPGKQVLEIERDVRNLSRQSLVVRRSIRRGQIISEQDLTTQRPGSGIPASRVAEVVGHAAIQLIPAGAMLDWNMIDQSGSTLSEVA
jgi:N,N'-diacetyllegionaminate synthase